ncbi:MAG: hypothetical protein ACR2O3_08195 [Rhizobiaceae bacterium]
MTFAQDQIRDEYHSEEHSPASVVFVSIVMIASAFGLLTALL